MDEVINVYLEALAACVCAEVGPAEDMCFCGITVGDQFISMSAAEDCWTGEAWVRVVSVYPSTSVGQADVTLDGCPKPLGLSLEVGILRCIEIPEDGEAPTPAGLLAASVQSIEDMVALRNAIVCCEHFPDVILGTWQPRGPEGGLVGGVWTLEVGI